MKTFLIKLINLYQKAPKRQSCKFYPSCSKYAKSAIQKYGTLKGGLLGLKRIFKCHPWAENQIDTLK